MKYLALFAILAGSMLLGACAHKEETVVTPAPTAHYSK